MLEGHGATSLSGSSEASSKRVAMARLGGEAGKVVWPTRQETVRTAIFVAIMMTILAVFFLGVDQLFGWVMRQLLALA